MLGFVTIIMSMITIITIISDSSPFPLSPIFKTKTQYIANSTIPQIDSTQIRGDKQKSRKRTTSFPPPPKKKGEI